MRQASRRLISGVSSPHLIRFDFSAHFYFATVFQHVFTTWVIWGSSCSLHRSYSSRSRVRVGWRVITQKKEKTYRFRWRKEPHGVYHILLSSWCDFGFAFTRFGKLLRMLGRDFEERGVFREGVDRSAVTSDGEMDCDG